MPRDQLPSDAVKEQLIMRKLGVTRQGRKDTGDRIYRIPQILVGVFDRDTPRHDCLCVCHLEDGGVATLMVGESFSAVSAMS